MDIISDGPVGVRVIQVSLYMAYIPGSRDECLPPTDVMHTAGYISILLPDHAVRSKTRLHVKSKCTFSSKIQEIFLKKSHDIWSTFTRGYLLERRTNFTFIFLE